MQGSDLYDDEQGRQASKSMDQRLETEFGDFIDKFSKGLNRHDVESLRRYYYGEGGRPTEEEIRKIQPMIDAIDERTSHLPRSERDGPYLQMFNWNFLLMDRILKRHKADNPGNPT